MQPLIAALKLKYEYARVSVVEALGKMGAAEAVPALTAVAEQDKDNLVRKAAAEALGKI